jgi:uncharacterized membrane protein YozB (DUF420 family)
MPRVARGARTGAATGAALTARSWPGGRDAAHSASPGSAIRVMLRPREEQKNKGGRMATLPAGPFESSRAPDRNFFLLCVLAIWLGVGMGFVPQILHRIETLAPPYPLIVHFHAVAFVGWLVLLTVQVLLIRARRPDIHRRLGLAGAVLACAMLALGPATAITMHGLHFGTPGSNPSFLSVQLTDMLAFAGLVAGAIALRRRAAAHKRLMLLATMYISDAGFARWLGGGLFALLGHGYWATLVALYAGSDVLIAGLGAYDLVTRRRLHPAYLAGVAWALANQLLAVALYFSAPWKPIALALIGR